MGLRHYDITGLWSLAIRNEKLVAGGVDGSLQIWNLNIQYDLIDTLVA